MLSKMTKKRLSSLILIFLVGCSVILGWGVAHSIESTQIALNTKSVDKATGNFVIGKNLYLENCATCHIPIPPAVLPEQTWEEILENPGNHYGVRIENLISFNQNIIWQYLRRYSRSLLKEEATPTYIAESRYFFALHPDVEFSAPITHTSCLDCHSQARNYNYRVEYELE